MIADIDVCVKDENDLQRLFARFLKQGIIQARHRPESDHLFSLNLSSEHVHFVIHFFCTCFQSDCTGHFMFMPNINMSDLVIFPLVWYCFGG